EAHQDLIGIVTSYADIEKNSHRGRMSALLSIEEGGVCQGELSFLRDFYRVGVRMMTLTWNFQNELAYPNRMTLEGPDAGVCRPETVHGLTERGIAGIRDVFAHTKKPLVASHSNARALAGHPRNLTDAMIRELSERGGVVGINYCAAFLRDWGAGEAEISRVSDMVLHMKHMKQIGGISCIGLGSDFDGIGGELELKSAAALPLLEVEMRKQGFTESEIEAVFYQNVLRVYREILK
ncbi:MAG: membrane dipeptidase, partial [Hungatella sp.]